MLTPELSVAVITMVPVYVLGVRLVAFTLTPNVLPPPLSDPELEDSTIHALLFASPVAVQVTGRAHVPLSLSTTVCTVEEACP